MKKEKVLSWTFRNEMFLIKENLRRQRFQSARIKGLAKHNLKRKDSADFCHSDFRDRIEYAIENNLINEG